MSGRGRNTCRARITPAVTLSGSAARCRACTNRPRFPRMAIGDLSHYVRIYDNNLDAALCRQLLDSFDRLQRFHTINGRGVRAGLEESEWTELNVTRHADAGFLGMFRDVIDLALERYNRDIALSIPIPNSPLTSD